MRLAPWLVLLGACHPSTVPTTCDTVVHVTDGGLSVDGGVCAALTLSASTDPDLTVSFTVDELQRVTPVVTAGATGGTFHALVLSGPWALVGDAPPVWWRQGYQSWSWSGVTDVTEPEGDPWPTVGGDEDATSTLAETPWSSWWAALLARPDGAALQVGALTAEVTKVWMASSPDTLWVGWGGRGEAIELAPGEALTLDPVWFSAGSDPARAWAQWAEQVAGERPGRGVDRAPPVGWSDWYEAYGSGDEDGLRAQLAAVAATPGMELFQVDDGWETAWGEWTTNDRHPSGTAALAADIAASGLTPGLWMAPFYVDRSTPTYAAHPDWWVRDASGAELGTDACDCAVLDVTVDAAGQWMRDQIAAKVAEGWVYLKLDFLYAGAVEGVRSEPVTGMQAYARGLQLLRSGAGDAWILGCGAPMLPTEGYVESWRSGTDIALVAAPDPSEGFLRWQARSTAARSFVNGLWWWNDADNLLLRAPFGPTEVRGALAAQVASGGVWLLGDDLDHLDDTTRALAVDPALLALRGQGSVPEDPLAHVSGIDGSPIFEVAAPDDVVPTRWALADGTVVLLNLGEEPVTVAGPGGTDLLTGEQASAGDRTLAPGDGEVWAP